MKQNKLTAVLVALLFSMGGSTANATAWRVNHDTTTGAHFASITAAMSSEDVAEGDTLYLDPACLLESAATVNKRVTIIGCGYFRSTSPHPFARHTGTLTIKAAGTKLEGLWCGAISLQAANITVERCYVTGTMQSNNKAHTGIVIRQCYISTGDSYAVRGGSTSTYLTNAIIENNIILSNYICVSYIDNTTVRNNYIRTKSDYCVRYGVNAVIYNNVLLNNSEPKQILNVGSTCRSYNNIYSSATTDVESHNYGLGSAEAAAVFAMNGNNDEQYSELKDNSPAKGWGVDGADCGPSGGLYPYIPGGMAAYHPYYTNAVISKTSDGTGINVSLKIKMQNE